MRRAAAAAAALAAVLVSGCSGGTPSADLFIVERTGSIPGARLTLRVQDGGEVTCNRRIERFLPSKQLIDARQMLRDLEGKEPGGGEQNDKTGPADIDLELPPRPGSILTYEVRAEAGTVVFSDNSLKQPQVFYDVAAFTRRVAKDLCGLPR